MKSVSAYAQLDLSERGALTAALLEGVPNEAGSQSVVLTGARQLYDARQPGLLTQGMASWFSKNVASLRVAAISEMKNAFESDSKANGGVEGVYLENRRDFAQQKSIDAAIKQVENFADKHKVQIADHSRTHESYRILHSRLGREPVRTKSWIYVLCLLGIVLLEAFINFESFMKVPYITSPFLATGATMAVGLAVGFAAHFHGVVFRQWAFLFRPQESAEGNFENRRNDAIRRLVIGGILLTIALLMVGASRYYYLREYIVNASILGVAAPSMFGGIFFMLLGNIVAYIIGLLVAYAMHDPHPVYAELDRKLKASSKRIEDLKKERGRAQEELRQGLASELSAITNQESSARGRSHPELREWANQIINKDQEVIGALLAYRHALLRQLGHRAQDPMFRYPDGAHAILLPVAGDQMLTGDEYASLPLSLGFNV
ncbi:hypothetical protein [Sphingobium sp. MP9-4]|uniref:hypothetical protein n=1 Tax=Sphingobium sp. MP9-4 TaxID=1761936 RepID=UPI0010CA929F|nr:hypothetical protein [Sphingobium sp. MP9-4]